MIPQGDLDMTAYLNELLRTNKLKQQNNTFWFPTPENPGKSEDHTPIQIRILKELIELKDKKTQSTREHRIPKRIPQTLSLDWHTSKRNRKTIKLKFPGRLTWHFRQTQNGFWDEHGIQGETNSKTRQCCLQPKTNNADPLERRPNYWISSDAEVWNHHSTAFVQAHKSHICTEEAQRKFTCPCGSPENQQSDCGWLYWQ